MALWRLALAFILVPSIHADGAQLDQSHFACQAHDLDKQFGELAQVQSPEVPDGAVGREVVGTQHAKCHVFIQLLGDFA